MIHDVRRPKGRDIPQARSRSSEAKLLIWIKGARSTPIFRSAATTSPMPFAGAGEFHRAFSGAAGPGHRAPRKPHPEFGKPAASLHPDLPHAATATRTPINAELPTPFCCYFSLLLAGGAL